ncbi:ATP-binding domain-containing protein 4 [Salpingoeca rosetta]|uniref:Diphthine--ammonia ligase n=1 Tax=Salpingoeca rosetta (strain ATCC 50818 / BSB-021) TaxID=946362 RepID=F2U0L2_SALR5|nr:ATP-binding domain-containing protein 4 [Salpingoeca rosetta]EGD80940.1 ATP-binding domain-containing protein 4 [Salpingoeca rosetta]|eukprot:XP_004997501.1 ATP-binding domain-containing protein 4 [Salpingoeca rosetta]
MDVVALVSGGKDSCHNMLHCVAAGHRIVALANIAPPQDQDEVDSYMYQTVGHEAITRLAQALELPLYRATITGGSVDTSKTYEQTQGDEVEDLVALLQTVLEHHPTVKGVSVGAILSDYQRTRVENICSRLNLTALSYLWQRSQPSLLAEMLDTGLQPIVIKVAAMGLNPRKHCGKPLSALQPLLHRLHGEFDLHVCGEGGEYETFTVDGPLFKKRLVPTNTRVVMHSDDAFAPVGYLRLGEIALEDKTEDELPPSSHQDLVAYARQLLERAGCTDWRAPADEEVGEGQGHEAEGATQAAEQEQDTHARAADASVHAVGDEDVNVTGEAHEPAPPRVESKTAGPWLAVCVNYPSPYSTHTTPQPQSPRHQQQHQGDSSSGLDEQVCARVRASLQALDAELSLRGFSFHDVRHINLTVRDMAQFAAINAEYIRHFGTNPPSRVCVQEALPPSCPLVIEAFAFKPPLDSDTSMSSAPPLPPPRHMHVQGLSHWAPANIGPYSQAVEAGGVLFMAGQIGLHPSSMTLARTPEQQASLSLRSVERVLQAHGLTLQHTLSCICFLRHASLLPHCQQVLSRAVSNADHDERFAFDPRKSASPLPISVETSTAYCVVPDLPKHAEVEWHFTAVTDGSVVQQQRDLPLPNNSGRARATAVVADMHALVHVHVPAEACYTHPQTTSTTPSSTSTLQAVVDTCVRQVADWLPDTCARAHLISCRVLCDEMEASDLATALDAQQEVLFAGAPVCVLPVRLLSGDGLVLHCMYALDPPPFTNDDDNGDGDGVVEDEIFED